MVTTKQALAGVGIATGIGLAIALLSGDAGASGGGGGGVSRAPWTEVLELPAGEEITEVKTVICTLDRGGVETSDLLQATLEHVYPGVPWGEMLSLGAVEGDNPTVWAAVQVITGLVNQYFALPPAMRQTWCASDEPPPPPPPKPTGGNQTTVPNNVIGGGWNDWPEKSKWPSQGAIGKSMDTAGYGVSAGYLEPGYAMTTPINRAAVKKFQQEWNAFRQKPSCVLISPGLPTLLTKYNPPKTLSVDGWIGPNTWKAMRVAFQVHLPSYGGVSWPKIISDCKQV